MQKEQSEYNGCSRRKDGKQTACRDCCKAQYIKQQRKHHLKSRYNITEEYVDMLLEKQEERCAICRLPSDRVLYVDHDHSNGLTRGLLCRNCNLGLGYFKDNADLLNDGAAYLRRYMQ